MSIETVLLYADEQFPRQVIELLRSMGYDVLTTQEAGKANQKISDAEVLAFATQQGRAVLTLNRRDFFRLHRLQPNHAGIVACTEPASWESLASRIDANISPHNSLAGQLIRIYKTSSDKTP